MIATEHQLNSPEQVREYLRNALTIVDEIDPSDDLRPIAFAKALDLISNKQVFFEQPQIVPNLNRRH